MDANDAIRTLSRRLDPARREFATRLYRRSLSIIEPLVLDSASLFWMLPNHFLVNLGRLLGNDQARMLYFFNCAHSRKHHVALTLLKEGQTESQEWFTETLARCYQPKSEDIRGKGLIDTPYNPPRLNRKSLIHSLNQHGHNLLQQDETDPAEPGRLLFRNNMDPWYVQTAIDFTGPLAQVSVECDVCIGMGPLHLERQLSMHSILGVGPLVGCDLAEPGQEKSVAIVLVEQIRFVLQILEDVLAKLDPGVSVEEIRKTEAEWIAWLSEARRARAARRKKR